MQVETYEVTELDHEGTPECEAEAVALIEQLGLEGQKKLLTGDGEKATRCPYRKLTAVEAFVYQTVCPKKSKLKAFADSPIPLRVLQVAAHANDLFSRVEVWSATDADIKDPVLIGINGGEYATDVDRFLLARWGDELAPFNELAEKAVKLFRANYKAQCAKYERRFHDAAERVDDMTVELLAAVRDPSVYGLD